MPAPRLRRWRAALAQRPSVREAALPDHSQRLRKFLLARDGALSRRIADRQACA
jgi:glutathione S-transferase